MDAAVVFPELKPGGEMLGSEAEIEMFDGHLAAVGRGAAGNAGPEFGNLGYVLGPVMDAGVEDGTNYFVLADVGIEMFEEDGEFFVAAQALVKCRFGVQLR